MANPLIQGFLEELKVRKGKLEADIGDAKKMLRELERQLREVTDVWNRLTKGGAAKEPLADPDAVKDPKPVRKRANKVPDEDIRDWIVSQAGLFTFQDMADAFGLSNSWSVLRLPAFIDKGLVEGLPSKGHQLRKFRYVKPTDAGAAATMKAPVTNGNGHAGAPPVAGTGAGGGGVKARNKEIAGLVAKARAQGYQTEIRGSGHIAVLHPTEKGRMVMLSSSPSDVHAPNQAKRDLIKIGVKL